MRIVHVRGHVRQTPSGKMTYVKPHVRYISSAFIAHGHYLPEVPSWVPEFSYYERNWMKKLYGVEPVRVVEATEPRYIEKELSGEGRFARAFLYVLEESLGYRSDYKHVPVYYILATLDEWPVKIIRTTSKKKIDRLLKAWDNEISLGKLRERDPRELSWKPIHRYWVSSPTAAVTRTQGGW